MSAIVEFATHTASGSQNRDEGARNRRTKSLWAGATTSLGFALMGTLAGCPPPPCEPLPPDFPATVNGVFNPIPPGYCKPCPEYPYQPCPIFGASAIRSNDNSAQPIVFPDDELFVEGSAVGSSIGDYLIGGAANQILSGSGGNDILEGRGGADTLDGGEGTDTASYIRSVFGVHVSLAADEARGGDADGDILVSIENLVGSDNRDELTGDQKPNALYGLGGNDEIRGGGGNDLLIGGKGDDDLYGGLGRDTYVFSAGDGSDTIRDVAGETMTLRFDGAYEAADFTDSSANFARVGNNLEITLDKTPDNSITDQITIENAYDADSSTGVGFAAFTINIEYGSGDTFTAVTDIWSALLA